MLSKPHQRPDPDPIRLNRLILFVADACNLRCRYCYVMRPGAPRGSLMTPGTAASVARRVLAAGSSCNYVQFFGGEPALNMPAIRAFVREVGRLLDDGAIARAPQFGVVTNGASSNAADLAGFCRENGIAVTVSLDGHREIHDALRPTAAGGGSFKSAVRTLRSLQGAGVPIAVETVYTSLHMDEGISVADIFGFVEALGIRKLIFHTAYPPAPPALCPFDDRHFERLVASHVDAVDWWFSALIGGSLRLTDVYFKDLLVPMLEGGGAGVAGGGCPAGSRDVAVAPNGDVYSCHLLYKEPSYRLGSLLEPGWRPRAEPNLPIKLGDIPECAGCDARHWCQPCGALNLSWGDAWTAPARECALRRAVVLRLGELAFRHLAVPASPVTDQLRRAIESDREFPRLRLASPEDPPIPPQPQLPIVHRSPA